MNINTVNIIRDLINATSIAIFIVVIGVAFIGILRPKALSFVLKEFAKRRYIAVGAIFTSMLCGTIYTATQADYGSYEASQPQPAAQTQTSLPQNSRSEAVEAKTKGISTEQPQQTTQSNQSTTNARPQPAPQPTPHSNHANEQPTASNNKPDERVTTNQSKPDKKCDGIQLLFACL